MTAPFDQPPDRDEDRSVSLSAAEKKLINEFQRDFPLDPRPFAVIADRLGLSEAVVMAMISGLLDEGVVDRVGPVIAPHRAGWSTLAAMEVPPRRLNEVAAVVTAKPEVNHNYEREHRFNLWFVLAGESEARVREAIAGIEADTGIPVMVLPLLESYRIDLGFPLP
ncbi:MAG: Lrp/AsnC family transcriptional regulator [Alphaproteobacteria bacterium]